MAEERVAFLPMFLGATPLAVAENVETGWSALPQEVARGAELMRALDDAQRKQAYSDEEVPDDVLNGVGNKHRLTPPQGLKAAEMTPPQQRLLRALVEEYVRNADFDAADAQLDAIAAAGWDALTFSWRGAVDDLDAPFYYRVQGPRIVIELRNTEDHIHTIVRDPANDYGEQWLGVAVSRADHGCGAVRGRAPRGGVAEPIAPARTSSMTRSATRRRKRSRMSGANRGYIYRTRVGGADAGSSVLAFHVARFRHSDEAAWRAAIDLGRVLVNGRRAAPTSGSRAGDELEFHRPPWREPDAPESFDVAFEDEHVLVVVKPAGLQVLPAGPFSARTLLELVRASDASRAAAAPAHRLGRGTSGLIAFGKTALGRSSLARQLRELTLGKTYLAWVAGARLPDSFAARQPIARVPHGPLTIHAAAAHGRPSLTRVRVLRQRAR